MAPPPEKLALAPVAELLLICEHRTSVWHCAPGLTRWIITLLWLDRMAPPVDVAVLLLIMASWTNNVAFWLTAMPPPLAAELDTMVAAFLSKLLPWTLIRESFDPYIPPPNPAASLNRTPWNKPPSYCPYRQSLVANTPPPFWLAWLKAICVSQINKPVRAPFPRPSQAIAPPLSAELLDKIELPLILMLGPTADKLVDALAYIAPPSWLLTLWCI